jgi:hypothetical protein
MNFFKENGSSANLASAAGSLRFTWVAGFFDTCFFRIANFLRLKLDEAVGPAMYFGAMACVDGYSRL